MDCMLIVIAYLLLLHPFWGIFDVLCTSIPMPVCSCLNGEGFVNTVDSAESFDNFCPCTIYDFAWFVSYNQACYIISYCDHYLQIHPHHTIPYHTIPYKTITYNTPTSCNAARPGSSGTPIRTTTSASSSHVSLIQSTLSPAM